jgi:hypothetical protein
MEHAAHRCYQQWRSFRYPSQLSRNNLTARVFRSQRAARTVGSIARSVTSVVVRAIAADVVPKAFTAEAPTMLHTMTSADLKPPQPPPHRRDQKAPNLPRSILRRFAMVGAGALGTGWDGAENAEPILAEHRERRENPAGLQTLSARRNRSAELLGPNPDLTQE